MNLFHDNGFVLRNQYLHDNPANQIGHGADAEDDEVTGRFTLEAHESHLALVGIGEEHTRTLINKE